MGGSPVERNHWLLPDGIEELLPPRARVLELVRRRLLDVFDSWGYELVMPPFVEFRDGLLSGVGADLEVDTFTLTDHVSGRLLGVRADITPQAARIDTHQLRTDRPQRLCYAGTVLRARVEAPGAARNPVQIGAELFGHSGLEADREIIELMLAVCQAAGVSEVFLDIGHVGVFRALATAAGLLPSVEDALFDALQRKSIADIESLLGQADVSPALASAMAALARLNGGVEVIAEARNELAAAPASVGVALDELEQIASALVADGVAVHVDLAELRGYRYQTGIVFAAYVPGTAREIARGGRYDQIGAQFGVARPATGFSADLRDLAAVGGAFNTPGPAEAVFAPADADRAAVAELRNAGRRVVVALGADDSPATTGCTHQLVERNGRWVAKPTE
ncbi:MAG: ATP phosphoribosyltransferase regulatory subunit [Chromatiales bacterium]|nr:ATP phosphoribosyltransferase regulatory subunit [Chromatiales bacterium]